MGSFAPVREYIDSLIHPSAQQDALTSSRHRAFIAPRLLGSLVALAAFPVYVCLRGVPSVLEVIVFAWLIAPILIAYYLSRTGQYESAHVLSSLALTGLVTAVAVETGGIGSFAAIWLVIVPLEAALSASRRVVALASTFAICAAGFLLLMSHLGALPPALPVEQERAALAALGIISASLYATGLALGAESLARTSFWLLYAEEDRYRLLARNMTDVITRHAKNGTVQFVSPAAEPLFGAKVQRSARPWLVRARACCRSSGLSHCARRLRLRRAKAVRLNSACAARDAGSLAPSQFVWIEMRCRAVDQAVIDGAGEREVVAVMRDITKRKEQEAALEEARAEAERANAAKSRFLATMSHELRTPLNAIIGFSEMLTKEGSMMIDAKRRHDYAHLINDSGHHLLSVVNGILDMSKIESGNFEITPEPFAPRQVIEECCALLGYKAREMGIDLVIDLPESLPDMVADKRSLQSDHAQSGVQRDQVHQARRQDYRQRARRRGQCSRCRSKIPASASAPRICRASAIRSSRRAHPMTAITTAPGSACRSSRAAGLARRRHGDREQAGRGHPRHHSPAVGLRGCAQARRDRVRPAARTRTQTMHQITA